MFKLSNKSLIYKSDILSVIASKSAKQYLSSDENLPRQADVVIIGEFQIVYNLPIYIATFFLFWYIFL